MEEMDGVAATLFLDGLGFLEVGEESFVGDCDAREESDSHELGDGHCD
jgi:hypothetical protein